MTFRELNKDEFDNFANSYIPCSFYQNSSYGDTMNISKYKVCYLGMLDNDKVVAATLILYKDSGNLKYGYAPRGFLIDYNNPSLVSEFTTYIKKHLSKMGIIAVKLSPMIVKNIKDRNYSILSPNPLYDDIFSDLKNIGYNHLGYNNLFEAISPRFEAMINLEKDEYNMFLKITKKFRTKIRSAESKGIRIYKGNINDLETLYNLSNKKVTLDYLKTLYQNFEQKSSVEIYYARLTPDIYLKLNQKNYIEKQNIATNLNTMVMRSGGNSRQKLLNKKIAADNNLHLYHKSLATAINLSTKKPEGITVALVMIIKSNNMINIVAEGYDKEYSYLNAKHLLIWKLIEKYGKLGYSFFNLGGITNKIENNKYEGLNNFKLSFGAKVYEYIGDLELITNKAMYIMYKNTAPLFKK